MSLVVTSERFSGGAIESSGGASELGLGALAPARVAVAAWLWLFSVATSAEEHSDERPMLRMTTHLRARECERARRAVVRLLRLRVMRLDGTGGRLGAVASA